MTKVSEDGLTTMQIAIQTRAGCYPEEAAEDAFVYATAYEKGRDAGDNAEITLLRRELYALQDKHNPPNRNELVILRVVNASLLEDLKQIRRSLADGYGILAAMQVREAIIRATLTPHT